MSENQSGPEGVKSSGKILSLLGAGEKAKDFVDKEAERYAVTISNFEYVYDFEGKAHKHPIPVETIWNHIQTAIPTEVIYSCANFLFTVDGEVVSYIKSPAAFFGFLFRKGLRIEWSERTTGCITKSEFFQYVGQTVPKFDSICSLPHEPPIKGVFYVKKYQAIETTALETLLSFFTLASEVYRDLLRAAFVTPFWGGPPGSRPMFAIDGIDGDQEKNRHIGKTTVSEAISRLAEGYVELSPKMDADECRKKLINAEGERIARIDNIKTLKLSSEALESLITTEFISGHVMYAGTRRIRNNFTHILTFNDASFSRDLATRSVMIRLARPKKNPLWRKECWQFMDEHHDEIIQDILFLLSKPLATIESKTRFPDWEQSVLAKVSRNLLEVQAEIKKGEVETDDDALLCHEIEDIFAAKIDSYRRNAATGVCNLEANKTFVALRKSVTAAWMSEIVGKLTIRTGNRILAKNLPKTIFSNTVIREGYEYWLWLPGWTPEWVAQQQKIEAYFIIEPAPRYGIFVEAHGVSLIKKTPGNHLGKHQDLTNHS